MLRDIKENIMWLSFAYAIASITYILYITKNLYTLIPISILVLSILVKKFKNIMAPSLYATMFFISIALSEGLYLSIPLALAIPFILGRENIEEELPKRIIFGPSALQVFRYLLISSLLMLVDLQILVPLTISSFATISYAIYGYIMLSKIRTDISLINNTVSWGEKVSALIKVDAPFDIRIVLEYGNNRNIYAVKSKAIFDVELPTDHVGKHVIELNVYALDRFCFSFRSIGRYEIEYNVIPLTRKALEVIREYIKEAADILSLPPAIEVSILELGESFVTITEAQSIKNIRILNKQMQEVRRRQYFGALLGKLLESFEEIAKKSSEKGGYKRDRYGEYIGSRPYISGDSIKFIHWKKSISRGSLVVKEFGVSSTEDLLLNYEAEGREPVILVDLYAPNVRDLDRLIYIFLQQCLKISKYNPRSKILIVMIIGNTTISLKGRSVDIIYQLYKVFSNIPIQTIFNYTSKQSLSEVDVLDILRNEKKPKSLTILIISNERFANELVKILLNNGFMPPRPFTLIYSSSLSFRYAIVKHVLSGYGFIYIDKWSL
ncbi:MAG: DUF58 domain-containing protein [Ignisphaera sp.]